MFDFRYYVASIAGLFLMLAVGILLGVGISGRGFVDDAERDRLNGRIEALEQEVEAASASVDESDERQRAARQFVESAYPVLVDRRSTASASRCSCSARATSRSTSSGGGSSTATAGSRGCAP